MKDRSFLYELRSYLVYVKVEEYYSLHLNKTAMINMIYAPQCVGQLKNPKRADPEQITHR